MPLAAHLRSPPPSAIGDRPFVLFLALGGTHVQTGLTDNVIGQLPCHSPPTAKMMGFGGLHLRVSTVPNLTMGGEGGAGELLHDGVCPGGCVCVVVCRRTQAWILICLELNLEDRGVSGVQLGGLPVGVRVFWPLKTVLWVLRSAFHRGLSAKNSGLMDPSRHYELLCRGCITGRFL